MRNLPLEEFLYARSVAKVPAKVTVLGPDRIAQRFKWEASRTVYDGLDDFVAHVVEIERQMIAELVKAGCKYIQIDAPGVYRLRRQGLTGTHALPRRRPRAKP